MRAWQTRYQVTIGWGAALANTSFNLAMFGGQFTKLLLRTDYLRKYNTFNFATCANSYYINGYFLKQAIEAAFLSPKPKYLNENQLQSSNFYAHALNKMFILYKHSLIFSYLSHTNSFTQYFFTCIRCRLIRVLALLPISMWPVMTFFSCQEKYYWRNCLMYFAVKRLL